MKKLIQMSSVLLLSSIVTNSVAFADEKVKVGKEIEYTSTVEEKSNMKDNNKEVSDFSEPLTSTTQSVTEDQGEIKLKDPSTSLLEKIDTSIKEKQKKQIDQKEKTEKTDMLSDKIKMVSPQKKSSVRAERFDLNDWETEVYDNGAYVLKKFKNTKKTSTIIPGAYAPSSSTNGEKKSIYISKDAFKGNKNLTEIVFQKDIYWDENIWDEVTRIAKIWDPVKKAPATSAKGMFSNMSNLQRVDFSGIDSSVVQDFSSMFENDSNLEAVDHLEGLNTENGTNFYRMFAGCTKLRMINLETMNFSKAVNMSEMFLDCLNLISIKMRNINNGVNMARMCKNTAVIYAQIIFKTAAGKASNVTEMFWLDYQYDNLPLLIYSNSQTFLTTEKGFGKDTEYTYSKFVQDARVLPFIITSGSGVSKSGYSQDGLFSYTTGAIFDMPSAGNYDETAHWHNAKICMLPNAINGYATNQDPLHYLSDTSSVKQTVEGYTKKVKPYPSIKNPNFKKGDPKSKPGLKDSSRFDAGYFVNETDDRYGTWKETFRNAPRWAKNIFIKVSAVYDPVNPQMSEGHVVNSKNPETSGWPNNRLPKAPLGFAYQPDELTAELELGDKPTKVSGKLMSGKQDEFHIGVRDFRESQTPWTVGATFTTSDSLFNGASIAFTKNDVKFNINNLNAPGGKKVPFASNQLVDHYTVGEQTYSLSGISSLVRNKVFNDGQTVSLMQSNGLQSQNFYDLNLGNLTLNLTTNNGLRPVTKQVGQINWNLSVGPNGH